jgi:hypothetical protein
MNNENVSFDDFEDVRRGGTIWEPKSTGKKKDNTFKELSPGEDSFIAGYYMGSEDGKGPKQNSTVHYLKLWYKDGKPMVGNLKHLSGDPKETSDNISIWGTGVLNGNVAEVEPGRLLFIKWLGKAISKKGGDPYHNWEIKVHPTARIEVSVKKDTFVDEFVAEEEAIPAAANEESPFGEMDDDDLI